MTSESTFDGTNVTSDESSDNSTNQSTFHTTNNTTSANQPQYGRPTTSSNSPYEVLLDQVTALQTDLSKTFAVCQQLRAENDSLSENYYRIKEDHTGLREKYSDTRRRFYDEQKLRMEVEQNHDSIVRSWKLQLDQKAQDFMELQQNMAPPRDLDLLRIKIQEELEAPHQEKVSRLEKETTKYREMFYNVRREHELLRTEFEQFSLDQGKREESLHESHTVVVNQLRSKISEAQAAKDDTAHIDEIRRLERQVNECTVRIESSEAENEDLRRAKEAATVSRDQAHLKAGRENMELLASVKTLEARAQNAEAHASSLTVQVERSARRVSEQQKRIAEIDHALSLTRRELEKKDIERADDVAAHAEIIISNNEECSLKMETITTERDVALKKIRDLQWELQTASATVESRDRDATSAVSAVKKQMKVLETRLATEASAVEKALEDSNVETKRILDELNETNKLLEQEREAHKTTKRGGVQEVERIRQRMIDLEEANKQVQHQSQEHVQEHAELHVEYNTLRSEHRETRAKEHALTAERESLEATIERLEDELASISTEHDRVAVAHLKAIKTQESTFRTEMEKQQHLSSRTMVQTTKKLAVAQKERQKVAEKSERYKDKALKEHNLVRSLKQDLINAQAGIENERARINSENEHLKSRLSEIERSRDILLMGTDGRNGGGSLIGDNDTDENNISEAQDTADSARRAEVASYMNKLRGLML